MSILDNREQKQAVVFSISSAWHPERYNPDSHQKQLDSIFLLTFHCGGGGHRTWDLKTLTEMLTVILCAVALGWIVLICMVSLLSGR